MNADTKAVLHWIADRLIIDPQDDRCNRCGHSGHFHRLDDERIVEVMAQAMHDSNHCPSDGPETWIPEARAALAALRSYLNTISQELPDEWEDDDEGPPAESHFGVYPWEDRHPNAQKYR